MIVVITGCSCLVMLITHKYVRKKNADTIYIRDLLGKQPFTRPGPKLSTCKTGYEKNRLSKKINDILM